jgi:arylformamidase
MQIKLVPKKLVHAENIGGEIDKLSNQRCWIGFFPFHGIEMESTIGRCIAILPPK